MSNNDGRTLNPDIKNINVGIKELREVKIYPLSMTDQFQLTEDLAQVINEMGSGVDFSTITNEDALQFMKKLLSENLMKILTYVTTEEERPTLDELTNNQFYEIANILFEVNYEGLLKNFKDLIMRAQGLAK